MTKTTINQLVSISGLSRYKIEKIITELGIVTDTEIRKNITVSVVNDQQKQQILEVAAQKKASKTEIIEADPIPRSSLEHTLLLQEISSLKARVELLLNERDYLREALSKEQENSKILSNQLSNQDARLGVVFAALSQPKELSEKQEEKKSFWQRIFG